jgi:hypothetical protein
MPKVNILLDHTLHRQYCYLPRYRWISERLLGLAAGAHAAYRPCLRSCGELRQVREENSIYHLHAKKRLQPGAKPRKRIARRQRARRLSKRVRTNVDDGLSSASNSGGCSGILAFVDHFTRECLVLEPDRAMNGTKVAARVRSCDSTARCHPTMYRGRQWPRIFNCGSTATTSW